MKCIMQFIPVLPSTAARPHPFTGCAGAGGSSTPVSVHRMELFREFDVSLQPPTMTTRGGGCGSLFVINCILHPVTYWNITRIHNEHQRSQHHIHRWQWWSWAAFHTTSLSVFDYRSVCWLAGCSSQSASATANDNGSLSTDSVATPVIRFASGRAS